MIQVINEYFIRMPEDKGKKNISSGSVLTFSPRLEATLDFIKSTELVLIRNKPGR